MNDDNNYDAVAAATTISKGQQDAIFAGLSQSQVKKIDCFTINDFASLVAGWCKDKNITPGRLLEIINQKAKKKEPLLLQAKKDLPFLFKEAFGGRTKPQKALFEMWKKNPSMQITEDDLAKAKFNSKDGNNFMTYIREVAQGKALHPVQSVSEVIIAAGTDTSIANLEFRLQLGKIDKMSLSRLVEGLESKSLLIRESANKNFDILMNSPLKDLSPENVWEQFMQMHNFRPTQVQRQILNYLVRLVTGDDKKLCCLIEGVTGSGKTYGFVIATSFILKKYKKSPIMVYSHPSLAVINGFEENSASVSLPMAFVLFKNKLVNGFKEDVIEIKTCHETLGRATLAYILKNGVVVRRIQSSANTGVTIEGKTGCSQVDEPVNPFLDLFEMITSRKGIKRSVNNQFPCVISVRHYQVLPLVMKWYKHVQEVMLPYYQNVVKSCQDEKMVTSAVKHLRAITRFLELFTGSVAIIDDWCCHKDTPNHMELLLKEAAVIATATPSKEAIKIISEARVDSGLSSVIEFNSSSDTVGQGIEITNVNANDARASTLFIEFKSVFENCFAATTLSPEQNFKILLKLLGPEEFRRIVLEAVRNKEGLNEIRKILVDKIGEGLDPKSLDTPVKFGEGKKLVFYNSVGDILSQLPVFKNCESDLKALIKAYSQHQDNVIKTKQAAESMKKSKGDEAAAEAKELQSLINETFKHKSIDPKHTLNSQVLMGMVETAIDNGVSPREIMSFVNKSVLAVYRGLSSKWYIPALQYAKLVLSDSILATGVTLTGLEIVSIENMSGLSAEQVIQMSGRAGRPGLKRGVVIMTKEQQKTVIGAKLGQEWCQSFKETFPQYCVPKVTRNLFKDKIKKYQVHIANGQRIESAIVRLQCWGRVLLANSLVETKKRKIEAKLRRKDKQSKNRMLGRNQQRLESAA
jgi:hypothetical protein